MKILIVGANSTLAKEVMPILADDNSIVTAGRSGCDIYCDVNEEITFPEGIHTVINFAAAFGGKDDKEIVDAEKTNSLGALNICMAAKKAGIKHIVNISSIFTLLEERSPYFSIYALTKKHGDELARFFCGAHEIPLTIIKPSQIYGDSDDFAKHQPFFYEMINIAQRGEDITIYGSNDPQRNFIHCADLAEILKRVVTERVEGIYACTNPSDVTYSQIARVAQEVFHAGGETSFLKYKPDIPNNIFPNDTSLYEKINYHPTISIEEGIRRIKEHREKGQR